MGDPHKMGCLLERLAEIQRSPINELRFHPKDAWVEVDGENQTDLVASLALAWAGDVAAMKACAEEAEAALVAMYRASRWYATPGMAEARKLARAALPSLAQEPMP